MDVPLLRKTHDGRRNHHGSQAVERADDQTARKTAPLQHPSRRGNQPWDPAAEFEELYDRVDRLGRQLFWPAAQDATWPLAQWSPRADVEETADAYVVELELPGVKQEDISIELSAGELFVSGEIKERERRGFWRSRTRRVGRFDYRVALPSGLDAEQVSASLSEGVLTITVAKTEQAKRRKIAINQPHPDPTRTPGQVV